MVSGKLVVSVISLVLVLGVVIGLVVTVHRDQDSENDENTTTAMKAVTTFCRTTAYKDTCATSFVHVAKNSTATSKDFLLAAIDATIVELNKSIEATSKIPTNPDADLYHHMALEECKQLLDDAIYQLRESYSFVNSIEMDTINDHVNELLNWLSAVYAYETTCLDQIEKPELKTAVNTAIELVSQLTDNAINIVADISLILRGFQRTQQQNTESESDESRRQRRRLLQVKDLQDVEVKDDDDDHHYNYPSWFPVADRRLLAEDDDAARQQKPHATVAKDRTFGQYMTISAAVEAYPKDHQGRYVIYVKAGVYEEQVIIGTDKPNVFIYGDGPGKTIVTGNKNYEKMRIPPSMTATFVAKGKNFIAKSMTFRNTAGADGGRGVALRVQSDESVMFDCSIEGYHDTLFYHALRQLYRNCVISGTIDFIFGMGSAVIQNSLIVVRKSTDAGLTNTVTADGKEKQKLKDGLVIHNCKIVADKELAPLRFQIKTYLGRPWKAQASTVVMQTDIADFIRPEGWLQWQGQNYHQTCNFAEFNNRGPGAKVKGRDKSFKNWRVLSSKEAARRTLGPFLEGHKWLNRTGAPFTLGLVHI